MDKRQAHKTAESYLSEMEQNCGLELAFNPELSEEHDVGFVFFYNTKKYWQTRDFLHTLAGNGPLLVRRDSGEIIELPSNQSVERSLSELAGH